MVALTYARRVASGGKVIDANAPSDWYWKVDLDTLDIRDTNYCVCGQVFRRRAGSTGSSGYTWAKGILFGNSYWKVADHGFASYPISFTGEEKEYAALNAQWRLYILDRRRADLERASEEAWNREMKKILNREDALV